MRAIDASQTEVSVSAGAELPSPAASRERRRKKKRGGEESLRRRAEGLMLSFQFLRMIQVTSASAENGSPHGAPPEGGGAEGAPPSPEYRCAGGGVRLHAPPPPLRIIHQLFMRLYAAVVVCLCVTVMPCDRMITPFSPQLRGVSRLHSSPCTAPHHPHPQRSDVLPHMSKSVSCGQQCSFASPSPSAPHPIHPPCLPLHIMSGVVPTLNH